MSEYWIVEEERKDSGVHWLIGTYLQNSNNSCTRPEVFLKIQTCFQLVCKRKVLQLLLPRKSPVFEMDGPITAFLCHVWFLRKLQYPRFPRHRWLRRGRMIGLGKRANDCVGEVITRQSIKVKESWKIYQDSWWKIRLKKWKTKGMIC